MLDKKIVLCADGVFVSGKKILLFRRDVEPLKGCWHIIGGHVEDHETFKNALKREYKEETNMDVEVGDIIDFRTEQTHDRTKIILILQVTNANGQIKLNCENSEYKWFEQTPPNSVCNYDSYLMKKKPMKPRRNERRIISDE